MEAFLAVRIVTPGSMAEIYGLTKARHSTKGKKEGFSQVPPVPRQVISAVLTIFEKESKLV